MAVLTSRDRQHVADVLNFFFPSKPIKPRQVNQQLAKLAALLMKEALEASHAMNFVPRPPAVPSVGWLISQPIMAFYRSQGKQTIYEYVRTQLASRFERVYDLEKRNL